MTDVIEYNKLILSKVSFNGEIFEKELFKALQNMLPQNRFLLIEWCNQTFLSIHYKVIRKFIPKNVRKSLRICKLKRLRNNFYNYHK